MPRRNRGEGFEDWSKRKPRTMAQAERNRPKETPVESPKPKPKEQTAKHWTTLRRFGLDTRKSIFTREKFEKLVRERMEKNRIGRGRAEEIIRNQYLIRFK